MPEADAKPPTTSPDQKDKDDEINEVIKELDLESDSDIEPFPPSEDEKEEEEPPESDYDSDDSSREDGATAAGAARGASKALPTKTGGAAEGEEEEVVDDNTPETNLRRFTEVLESRRVKRREEDEDEEYVFHEDLFDFPRDRERWTEDDLQEYWAEAPLKMTKPGWDPVWADEEDWQVVNEEIQAGRDPPIAPFYVPYHKNYPAIPDNHYDISNPKSVIEELDRIEEFLTWVSYIFPDGSSYEGTVWDDLAHGKGVYVADQGLVRYEGEWLQNAMDGHGVVEVEIPEMQPVPGSELEAKMRAEGKIIKRDFMSPEDQKWLDMDIEDSIRLTDGVTEVPFYENDAWIDVFGEKPEKGRYKYAGQWKQGRMHGCGVYEVNERIIYGRFYFGQHLDDSTGCDADVSALHAGIAEVAAAKARMFVNKPDGMVREERGPYGDPQHPYFYEDEDVWMAPGFINQFYEAPDYWKTYVEEVDKEREMWLNSFYKSPLRIPMPAELEYWWETDESPEFVLINKEPEPDPNDPSKLVYSEDPLIYHTRTGRIINYIEDEEYGVRLFWQPPLKEGEDVDPEKAEFLPLGFDEFYGRTKPVAQKENWLLSLVASLENALNPLLGKLEKWVDEKKKASEMNQKLIQHELDLVEAEICLEEEIEDLETELKRKQKEEEKKAVSHPDIDDLSISTGKEDVESDGEDEDEGEAAPSSFGSVSDHGTSNGDQSRRSPFSSLSMSAGTYPMATAVTTRLWESFWSRKRAKQSSAAEVASYSPTQNSMSELERVCSVSYPRRMGWVASLKVAAPQRLRPCRRNNSDAPLNELAQALSVSKVPRRSKEYTLENSELVGLRSLARLDIERYPYDVLSLQSLHVRTFSL